MTPTDLLAWRQRQGWTQQQAADALGRSLRSYHALERGEAGISRETELACETLERMRSVQDRSRILA